MKLVPTPRRLFHQCVQRRALERRLGQVLRQLLKLGHDWGTLSGLCLKEMGVPRECYTRDATEGPKR